jgi:hypothetical protein
MEYAWEPTITLKTLRNVQIHRLDKKLANKIWNVDEFLAIVPDGMIKSWRAHLVGFNERPRFRPGIGCDPGLKLGISAVVAEDVAYTFSTYLNRSDFSITDVLDVIQKAHILMPRMVNKTFPVVVEGAAYGMQYGQPLLGELRAALLLGYHNAGYDFVAEVPPKSIRKKVFGDGKVQPHDFWKPESSNRILNKDEADALSMAICAGL